MTTAGGLCAPQVPGSHAEHQQCPCVAAGTGEYQQPQGRGTLQVAAVDDETRMEGEPAIITAPSHGNVGFSVNL